MRDIRRYWAEVRALEASLPEFVWLVDAEGSHAVEVQGGMAAQLLLARSHRRASPGEIRDQRESELAKTRQRETEARRRTGIAVVGVA